MGTYVLLLSNIIYKCTFSLAVILNSSSSLTCYPRPVSQYVIVVRVQARVNVTLACRCLVTTAQRSLLLSTLR